MRRLGIIALALACGAGGCRPVVLPASEIDPQVTFAARQVHNGFVIDRLPGGGPGSVVSARLLNWDGRAEFRVSDEGGPIGIVALTAPARVRMGEGEIQPSWDDGAIRLTLPEASGATLHLGPFERIGWSGGYSVLSRNARTNLDVVGRYRAVVLDANDEAVGWWEVKVADPIEPRRFQGVLPGVSPLTQAGLVVALDSEIDWIEDHVLDVYRGSSGGRLDLRPRDGR
jgi:hypothetical protein